MFCIRYMGKVSRETIFIIELMIKKVTKVLTMLESSVNSLKKSK